MGLHVAFYKPDSCVFMHNFFLCLLLKNASGFNISLITLICSTLCMCVEPDGPSYQIQLRGVAKDPLVKKTLAPEKGYIHCNSELSHC